MAWADTYGRTRYRGRAGGHMVARKRSFALIRTKVRALTLTLSSVMII
jgi:hypothetical protein